MLYIKNLHENTIKVYDKIKLYVKELKGVCKCVLHVS